MRFRQILNMYRVLIAYVMGALVGVCMTAVFTRIFSEEVSTIVAVTSLLCSCAWLYIEISALRAISPKNEKGHQI